MNFDIKVPIKRKLWSLNVIQSIYEHTNFTTSATKYRTAAASNKPEATLAIWRSSTLASVGRAHTETQATQPAQGGTARVSIIHTSEYVGAN
jgi:hypothetical protein